MSWPAYLDLLESGELERRAGDARAALASCALCPRACNTDRNAGETGVCHVGARAIVASYGPHFGEESCLSGRRGSGTVFFSGCNLNCIFCQNWDISHRRDGTAADPAELACFMLELQAAGCHNINLVTPSHVVPHILEALVLAVGEGLRLPLVYNSGGYDAVETLRRLDGVVDIYMPDFKLCGERASGDLLLAPDYPQRAGLAIAEMHRQVGDLEIDETHGLARRGLLVRHLVMPGLTDDSRRIFAWLAGLSPDTFVNVMEQYRPCGDVRDHAARWPDLLRSATRDEHTQAVAAARAAGLTRAGAT